MLYNKKTMRNRLRFRGVLFFFVIFTTFMFTTCKPPVETEGNIRGTVLENGTTTPISGVTVRLSTTGVTLTTGGDGAFEFMELDPTLEHEIHVSKEGYNSESTVVKVYAGEISRVDIPLKAELPELLMSTSSLDFGSTETTKSFFISNEGVGTLTFDASSSKSWITINPSTGDITNNTFTMNISVNRTGLGAGVHSGTVVINSNGSEDSDEKLTVTMNVPVPGAPNTTTDVAFNISQTTSQISGEITSIGSETVSEYGHCWSTSENPTINDAKTNLGSASSTITFTSTITSLIANTNYYVKAYAINNVGTSYSSQVSFTTTNEPTKPTVTINEANNIVLTGADLISNITDIGSSNVTQHGHCWSTTQSPTTANSKTSMGATTLPGSYTSNLANLAPNATYYARGYAENSEGISYSSEISFTTSSYTLANISTESASDITFTSFNISGNIIDQGNSSVSQHGHCWSLTTNPTIADNKTAFGTGSAGVFSSSISSLEQNTTYYVKSYATNSAGTSYGDEVAVQTLAPSLANVTTGSASDISFTSFNVSGNILDLGNTSVTEHGHCWSTSQNPTTSNGKTTYGEGTVGNFLSTVSGLQQNTTYYIKSYATNSAGISYGDEVVVQTLTPTLPTVTTSLVTNIDGSTVTCGGDVTYDGGTAVTAKGVCWSTSQNPTILNNHTTDGSGEGEFISNLIGLNTNTTYFIRAYSTNSIGTQYGTQATFTTSEFVITSGLVAYWHFDNQDASDYLDNSNGNVFGCSPSTDSPNSSGQSMQFVATEGNYIQGAQNPVYGFSKISMSTWVKTSQGQFWIFRASQTTSGHSLYIQNNKVYYGSNAFFSTDISSLLLDGQWHMLSVTHQSSDGSYASKLYIDGEMISSAQWGVNEYVVGSSGFTIGSNNAGYYYNGKLDNFRIYNRVLTGTEIQAIYDAQQ